jgi:pSer/pThr/pTyr-binding forkhead associated (FHA) protein
MFARLIPTDGTPPVELKKEMTLVGRNDDCDIYLDHKSVSKLHCILVKTDGLILVRDLGSTNGTRVNGQRVRRAALLPNDNLAIANFKYQVSFGPDADAEADGDPAMTAVGVGDPGPIQRNSHPDMIE